MDDQTTSCKFFLGFYTVHIDDFCRALLADEDHNGDTAGSRWFNESYRQYDPDDPGDEIQMGWLTINRPDEIFDIYSRIESFNKKSEGDRYRTILTTENLGLYFKMDITDKHFEASGRTETPMWGAADGTIESRNRDPDVRKQIAKIREGLAGIERII